MKNKKGLIITLIVTLVIIVSGVFIYIYSTRNGLTISEKQFIENNSLNNKLLSINVENDSYVFGYDGSGVFFDFLNDFKNEYGLNINNVTYKYGANVSPISLGIKHTVSDDDVVFYKDHYVLISKNNEFISNISDISGKISTLSSEISYVSSYVNSNVTFVSYNTIDEVFSSLSSNRFAIVPLHLYLKNIFNNNLNIVYHFSDMELYYSMSTSDDELSSILTKYYNKWSNRFEDYYNSKLFDVLTSSYNITETEIDAMRSVEYKYGYVNNSPYEVISSGSYGGIVSIYLNNFAKMANIDFRYTRYKNFSSFKSALNNGKIDIYFDYYNANNNQFFKTNNGILSDYYVVAHEKNDLVLTSVNSLKGKTIYVDKNSHLYTYFKNIKDINVKTYNGGKSLYKFNNKDVYIVIDTNIYDYYKTHGLSNYTIRYADNTDYVYSFNVDNKSGFYKLFDAYTSVVDPHKVVKVGYYNHEQTIKGGRTLINVARYVLILVLFGLIVLIISLKKKNKVTVINKLKKDDTVKFIDQLTLLKNRNYLSENISNWNKNNIYPQTILLVELNKIQEINDTKGYEEGDRQIKAAANALIKTQLDNSDIIRTNGNEFVIYLIGYSQKQITNYIHKIVKELDKLPYKYGAEYGYTMITDEVMTIEDALNEAVKEVKEKKGHK